MWLIICEVLHSQFVVLSKNDEALVAEEMRRTTEAAGSEDTMFEEPASGTDQQTSLTRELHRVNFLEL